MLNKFACIVKQREHGTTNRPITVDSIASGVTECTRRQYRAALPRQSDLMADVLILLDDCKDAESILLFVLDADDAYWQVPWHPAERPLYCARLQRGNRQRYAT